MKKTFCITGVSGQDGSYAAELLINLGINVVGLTRDKKKYLNLKNINENKKFLLVSTDYSEESLKNIIYKYKISHILNFAGQSYVSKSWELIEETITSQSLIVSRIINIIQKANWYIKFINSCSAEIYKESFKPLNESSELSPCNPYGCAQLLSYCLIKSIRENSNIWACSAIFFPHESSRRGENFLFNKLIVQAERIIRNENDFISIGNDFVVRDWGFAIEYVYYIVLLILNDEPIDLCFCSGKGTSVKDLAKIICSEYELNFKDFIKLDESLSRSYESDYIVGDNSLLIKTLQIEPPSKIKKILSLIINNRKSLNFKEKKIDTVSDFLTPNQINRLKDKFIKNP